MQTTSITTRIDPGLKSRAEAMAKAQDRSLSYVTNKALARAVEEHEKLAEVLALGQQQIQEGHWYSKEDVLAKISAKQWS